MRTWDGHVTLGHGLDADLTGDDLIAAMDRHSIERSVVAPPDRFLAVANAIGNSQIARMAAAHPDRLIAFATANPWLEREALDVLAAARDQGARALRLDPAVQGFEMLGPLADPLVEFATSARWPVYVRTGTPIRGLPLQLAELARRHPSARFIMGRSGATDFWLDVIPALERAPNVWADTAYSYGLAPLLDHPTIGPDRIVFTSDAPYSDQGREVRKTRELLPPEAQRRVLADNLADLLGEPVVA